MIVVKTRVMEHENINISVCIIELIVYFCLIVLSVNVYTEALYFN